MSILIKGMEMPETCVECKCFDGEWLVCSITGFAPDSEELFEKRDDACPLVEVQEDDMK